MADTFTVDSHGITCSVDKERLADQRFMYCLSKVSDEMVSEQDKLLWYTRMLDTLFGDMSYAIMCDLADHNGGSCSIEFFNEFFGDVLEQAQAKNS